MSTNTQVSVHCDGRPGQTCQVWLGFGRSIRDIRRHARNFGWAFEKAYDRCAGCKREPEPACGICGARRVPDGRLLLCSFDEFHGGVLDDRACAPGVAGPGGGAGS